MTQWGNQVVRYGGKVGGSQLDPKIREEGGLKKKIQPSGPQNKGGGADV